ncbi:hypothetical protein FALBO_7443 [Fusarium albosuccineum]|uniref:Uncharacterized protein n=1 Tax=Fusarium albosuccineum TaxID=1237068 RepID=A0A8H4LDV7_9HYPO|nr:hypothetical protein FALBO_7443 [Fusarium albosuccineum]
MERQSYELLHLGTPAELENKPKDDKVAWPPEPRPLPQSFWASSLRVAAFAPLLLLPIPFAVLLRLIFRLDGQPLSQHGSDVFQGMGLASTLWPIAFAAVLGSLARTVALYKAEKGTNLGTLGVLLGSQTLMSTLTNAFALRILSFWVVLLCSLWALSPVGGQAVLRAVHVTSNIEVRDYDLVYSPAADIGIPFNRLLWESAGAYSSIGIRRAVFGAALCAPNSLGQAANGSSEFFNESMRQIGGTVTASLLARTDLWGNVRVPQLASLPGYSSTKPHKWVDVPTDQLVTYESLIGIPFRGLPVESPGNFTVQISATYVTLEWLLDNPGILYTYSRENITEYMAPDRTSGGSQVYMDAPNATGGFNFSAQSINSTGPVTRGTFVFGTNIKSTICDMYHVYVDVDVSCERLTALERMTCRANRARRSLSHPVYKPDDQFLPTNNGHSRFFAELPWLAPSGRIGSTTLMESYLADPSNSIGRSQVPIYFWDWITTDYSKLPMPVFAERLAIVINTALRVSWSPYAVLNFEALNITDERSRYGNTTGPFTTTTELYRIRGVWMALSTLSLVIMFSAAAANLGLRLMIQAPDFLTHVAALTRDSKHMDVAPGGSTLSGDERARLLKDLPLKIMDIEPDDAVGYIALSDKPHHGSGELGNTGRIYR